MDVAIDGAVVDPRGRFTAGLIGLGCVFVAVILIAGIGRAYIVDNTMMAPHIRVASFTISNFSVSDSHLGGNFRVGFKMSNPNEKTEISVGEFSVSIRHSHVDLARARFHKNQGTLQLKGKTEKNLMVSKVVMKLAQDSPAMRKKKVFARIEKEWSNGRRVVNFDLGIRVTVRFHAGDTPTESKLLLFACDRLTVVFYVKNKGAGRLAIVGHVTHECHPDVTA